MLSRKFLSSVISILMIFSLTFGGTISVSAAPDQNSGVAGATSAMPMGPVDESVVPHYFGPWPNYANSSFIMPDVTVEIVGDGAGATAAATVGAGGVITGVSIVDPGSGYTGASVVFTSATGTGAAATVSVNPSGSVTSIMVDTPGAGYVQPSVIIAGGGGTGTLTQVGNTLLDRAFATDAAPSVPVFVIVPAPLPVGFLTDFLVQNQAAPAGTPSAGQSFNAYVLRATGVPNEYQVVFDSGLLTVPALADPSISETAAFPVGSVAVQAGDVIAFYGAGIPFDSGAGADLYAFPAPAAPVQGGTVTFPGATEARTYSFAANVVDTSTVPPLVGATATAYGGVDQITVNIPGIGYSFPTVDIDMPDDPNGFQAKAHVNMNPDGSIAAVVVDSPGSGYASAPGVAILDGTRASPVSHAGVTFTEATASATLAISSIQVDTFGGGYSSAPTVTISDTLGAGAGATASAQINAGSVTGITLTNPGSGYVTQGGIKKFQDGLPVLCDPSAATGAPMSCADNNNNLGQHIPIGIPDTTTFPGTDYYVIGVLQHRERMSSSLPADGTLVREYVQLETADNAAWSKHVALQNEMLTGAPVPITINGAQAYAVDDPHYLGPVIVAQKDRAVRIVFYNLLPTGAEGDLFLPVDTTFMGAGMGPMEMMPGMPEPASVMDMVRNPLCGEPGRTNMDRMNCFAETRATLHLHGGITPWISDGSPHQWITPANEHTGWPEGVSVRQVPDMVGPSLPAGAPDCSAANDGCMTFYYTNQQSARLMFYHDHAWGITRLNVYAGEAAGYVLRDGVEGSLISRGLIPSGADEIPLVIQDKTFVPNPTQMAAQDPTWDYTRWGNEGDLWYEHVYMPAQNPGDPGGMSSYGRWMYGPWFWPPAAAEHGPIANPYYNMDPVGPDGVRGTMDDWTVPLAVPCNLDDPATWQYDTDPFCEPQMIPGTPNNSAGMEQFNDTPVVNGTAYPTVTLQPKSYRLRILNAANDRFWNLQWYIGDPRTADPIVGPTEVALNAAEVEAAQTDPVAFPTPDLTFSPAGPDWIQIGTEGGFLPAPVVIDGQQHTTWIQDPTRFDVGNVDQHSLLLAPAERADVIVDFSQFAGQTLILYNDAPAAFPARVPSYDYYTGAPDMWPNGAPVILPGYGPNTRTIMQVKIAPAAPAPAFNLTALKAAFKHQADGSGVFESGQHPIIVGQAGYNSAYGKSFASGSWCNAPANPTAKCDGFARISEQGGNIFKFDTLSGLQLGVRIEPKAIHDETNSTTFEPFGRMSGNLGVEVSPATPGTQNVVLYPFVNPPTEMFNATNLPSTDTITPISVSSDGTQIWKFTHNGVDTHPIHFHLYDVQLLNRVTWDNIVIPPDPNELGWKDTVRVSPLEDTYFAIRPILPVLPWELPNSIRPINPMMPVGDTTMFNPTDPNGNGAAITNEVINFGWEYMLHCHILSHEEMDMMRPATVALPPLKPTWQSPAYTINTDTSPDGQSLTLNWDDNSITETSFVIQRRTALTGWETIATILSPLDSPLDPLDKVNIHEPRSYEDTTYVAGTDYQYQIMALNTVGYGGAYPSMTVQSMMDPLTVGNPFPPHVVSILRASPNPIAAPSVNFTVTFSEPVSGVDSLDFSPLMSGTVSGSSISGVYAVAGGGDAVYTVSVNTGAGIGTLGLGLYDNDSIVSLASALPLGGAGTYVAGANPPAAGDGSFLTGEVFNLDYAPPSVVSMVRLNLSPTAAASVNFRVNFSEAVTGVNAADFSLANSTAPGIAITSVTPTTGSSPIYTVTVSTGTGSGSIALDLIDNDSIRDAQSLPLGGAGIYVPGSVPPAAGDGSFFGGPSYTIDRTPPAVSTITRASVDPTYAASVDFTVTFSEAVTGVNAADFQPAGTITDAAVTGVTGSGTTYTVSVSTGTGEGTLQLNVVDDDTIRDAVLNPLGGAGLGNGNYSAGEVYNVRPPLGAGVYDDMHVMWTYTGSWPIYNGSGPSANTMHYTYGLGNAAQVFINGAQFKLIYTASANYGIVNVFVDDVQVGSFNQNSSPSGWQKTWTSNPLTPGIHKVQFVKASSSLQINIDAIEVFATAPAVLLPGKYDDPDAALTYSTGWFTASGLSGPYLGTLHYTYGLGNFAQTFINGVQFKLTYTASSNYGMVDVYVDDVKVASLNQNSSPSGWQKTWTSNPLAAGVHKVRLVKASSGLQINIDAIEVLDVAPTVLQPGKYDDPDAALTYSTGWFTASGMTGPYQGTLHYTYGVGNSVLTFINGTGFTLTYTASSNYGMVDVYVDDVLVGSFDQNSAPSGWQKSWTSGPLAAGIHKVKFVKATTGLQINIDAIEVIP